MPAVLFGSIGSIVETSELQRHAFNAAFAKHGLDWEWSRSQYTAMLRVSGGEARIAKFASEQNVTVDSRAIHESKSELFQAKLNASNLVPRSGVLDVIAEAKSHDWSIAFVTTTSPANVNAVLNSVSKSIGRQDFQCLLDRSHVSAAKPSAEIYNVAIDKLGLPGDQCIAVEDNADGVASAVAAGLRCVAFPGENTLEHDFPKACCVVEELDFSTVQPMES
jgi:HAD superfamily hydrolase (TIGR01509 family)